MRRKDALDVLHSYQVHLLRATIRRSHRDLRRFLKLLTRHSMKILSAVIISREEEGEYTIQLSLRGSEKDFEELLRSLESLSGGEFLKSFGIKKGRVFGSTFLSDSIRIERGGAPVLLVDWRILSSVIAAVKELVGIASPRIFEFCGERAAEEEIKKVKSEFYEYEKREFSERPMESIKRFLLYFLLLSWYEGFEVREREVVLKWGEELPEFVEMSSHFICGFMNRVLQEFYQGKMKVLVKEVKSNEAVLEILTENRIILRGYLRNMTEELFYQDPYLKECEAELIKAERREGLIEAILDRTIFYPTGGGQPCDLGKIVGKDFEIELTEVKRKGNEIIHVGKAKGEVKRGKVKLILDWERRYDMMQQHTGQHILSAAILRKLGKVSTGFQIFSEYSKIEVEFEKGLSWELIEEIEKEANEAARRGMEVKTYFGEAEDLRKKPEKFHGMLRIVEIGDYDKCACGGLHVKNSCEVLPIKVLRFYRKTSRIWRIEFACGNRALKVLNGLIKEREKALKEIGKREMSLSEAIEDVLREIEKFKEKEKFWRSLYIEKASEFLKSSSFDLCGRRVCIGNVKMEVADKICEELSDLDLVVLMEGKNVTIYSKEGIAKEILKNMQKVAGGKGGGSKNFVRGRLEREMSEEEVKNLLRNIC